MTHEVRRFFASRAWIQGAWARDVVLTVAADGCWLNVLPNASAEQQRGAVRLGGPVLPGMVNAHSHAFQRAMAGLTERRGGAAGQADDFWTWRERMYSVARRITPEQLEAVASLLYAELLQAGYTQVCEFHYLHGAADGQPQGEPLEMALALVRAAQRVGIGLTLLPTLYMRAGFGAQALGEAQRRFASTPESVLRAVEAVARLAVDADANKTSPGALLGAGVAVHSLRAVDAGALQEVAAHARKVSLPLHIHVAEQTQEVDDCVAHTGLRPVEWLLQNAPVDARWNLVHATHADAAELRGVRKAGASIVLCPSTEADLGDGVFDLPGYLAMGGRWSVGSDSQVSRQWTTELRLLEYMQRMQLRQRNVAARAAGRDSTAAVLFEAAIAGGRAASGQRIGAIQAGHRADFVILDDQSPALLGIAPDQVLDAMVFSSPSPRLWDVFVAGQAVVTQGRVVGSSSTVPLGPQLGAAFTQAMAALWA
ncbi:formimidoylglutamate deiminase [Pseudorhodoferax sp.]|uniref:formimidoylglutamate deiminase n=1 Tax=Pseudorhodoferax sp. TaxID=1993553 RepID=UPI002DD64585|nr:formimidoylglutamate deiminase [Pseudorhodoferax sp.]